MIFGGHETPLKGVFFSFKSLKKFNSRRDSEYLSLAKKYSEDKNTSFKGGKLNSFSSGQLNSIELNRIWLLSD